MIEQDDTLKELQLSEEFLSERAEVLGVVLRKRFGNSSLPNSNQSCAITSARMKTAALVFDRVWSLPGLENPPPVGIGFYGATDREIIAAVICLTFDMDQVGSWNLPPPVRAELHRLFPPRSGPVLRLIAETELGTGVGLSERH